MLEWLTTIPLEVRCLAIFLLGLVLGGQINRGIYRLAWNARAIGPWSLPHESAPPRNWFDRVPVVGWFGLSREAALHGRGFWIRPVLIELGTGLGLAALYWLEVQGWLMPTPHRTLLQLPAFAPEVIQQIAHARFVSHATLIALMIVATFIDFDEKTIPDWITIPGTLLGLLFAAVWPTTLSTVLAPSVAAVPPRFEPLLLTSVPFALWPAAFDGGQGLGLGLACLYGWCLAVEPKLWTLRRGWLKAFEYLWASTFRNPAWWVLPAIAVAGTPLIVWVWSLGGLHWAALLSSLVGLAFGGALVWAVRIIGSSALSKEAMGFGDVTLMAMIGAFVGWQASLIVFFVAPFAALLHAVTQWLFTRRNNIAFGPYLCAGALYVLLRWPAVWGWIGTLFTTMGQIIPLIVVVCLALMWLMLAGLRWMRGG